MHHRCTDSLPREVSTAFCVAESLSKENFSLLAVVIDDTAYFLALDVARLMARLMDSRSSFVTT